MLKLFKFKDLYKTNVYAIRYICKMFFSKNVFMHAENNLNRNIIHIITKRHYVLNIKEYNVNSAAKDTITDNNNI